MKKRTAFFVPVVNKLTGGRSNGVIHRRRSRKNWIQPRRKRPFGRAQPFISAPQNGVIPPAKDFLKEDSDVQRLQFGEWHGGAWSQVGGRHLQAVPPVPCQDASAFYAEPRAAVVVADGAGSSHFSHLGAEAVVRGTLKMLHALNPWLEQLLDQPQNQQNGLFSMVVRAFTEHARMSLSDLAERYHHPFKEFRCTYLAVIAGKENILWFKIGDGEIYFRKAGGELLAGEGGKGEFANQTRFLHPNLQPKEVEHGLVVAHDVYAAGVMSDGAAERMISQKRDKLAAALRIVEEQLVAGKNGVPVLHQLLNTTDLWVRTTGDDRSLAVMARKAVDAEQ